LREEETFGLSEFSIGSTTLQNIPEAEIPETDGRTGFEVEDVAAKV
jgi:hypothetical protein